MIEVWGLLSQSPVGMVRVTTSNWNSASNILLPAHLVPVMGNKPSLPILSQDKAWSGS